MLKHLGENRAGRGSSEIITSHGLGAAVFWFRNWDNVTFRIQPEFADLVGSGQTALTG